MIFRNSVYYSIGLRQVIELNLMRRMNKRRFLILTLVVAVSMLILLQTSPIWAEAQRIVGWDKAELLRKLRSDSQLDSKFFWEWRDETNGTFMFDPQTTHAGMTRRINLPTAPRWLLHTFHSKTVAASSDYMFTEASGIANALQLGDSDYPESDYSRLIKGDNFLLVQDKHSHQLVLMVVRDAIDLPTVDGLFDFIQEERRMLEKSRWVTITYLN